MSKITVTTIAGLTSGGDANKVKIDPTNTFHVPGHAAVGADIVASTRALSIAGATDGGGSEILNCFNSSLASKFSVRDDGLTTVTNNATVGGTFAVTGQTTATGGLLIGSDPVTALDDYEEGNWTPQLRGGGVNVGTTVYQGYYTKIGNAVHCQFNIARNDSATNNNNMELRGIPFPSRATPALVGQAWIDNTSNDKKCFLYLPSSSTTLYFQKAGENNGYVNFNEFNNGRYIYAAFMYMTDS